MQKLQIILYPGQSERSSIMILELFHSWNLKPIEQKQSINYHSLSNDLGTENSFKKQMNDAKNAKSIDLLTKSSYFINSGINNST